MVLINGQNIPTNNFDTVSTFISKLALTYKTLPKYLVFSPPLTNLNTKENIIMTDILSLIKQDAEKSTTVLPFLASLPKHNLNTKNDIIKIWLAHNTVISALEIETPIIISAIEDEMVNNGYFGKEEFNTFWTKERDETRKNLKLQLKQLKRDATFRQGLLSELEEIKEGMVYTPFELERASITFNLLIKNSSLLELFNSIILNDAVPFAVINTYYKILKSFIPPIEWREHERTNLILKISEKDRVDVSKTTEYIDCIISDSRESPPKETDDPLSNDDPIKVETKLKIIKGNLNKEDYISRVINVFSIENIQYSNLLENDIIGIFYFPMQRFDMYVLSDLIMNDPVFSGFLVIDESIKTSKKKSEMLQPWLYIHFESEHTGHITAGITQRITHGNEQLLKQYGNEIFPIGMPYVRIRVKGKDKQSVLKFQDIFSKLMNLYILKYNDVVDFYREYIPEFGEIEEIEIEPSKTVENVAPDIFIKNYTRICNEKRMPTIIEKEETGNYENVMKFPRDKVDQGKSYPSDGVNQKYYVCLNPEFPYPGVQENRLNNSEAYPYVPCCFKTNQLDKKYSLYKEYFSGEKIAESDKKQQDLIKTDKILIAKQYGKISLDLEKIFRTFDINLEYSYIRLGVPRSYSSFLYCVLLAIDPIFASKKDKDKTTFITEIREQLSKKKIAILAKQSLYDKSLSSISNLIQDTEVYFNPKYFIQLLEEYFNCNIYVFNKNTLLLPNYIQSYYRLKRKAKNIFIYENWGSESDHAKYPQCELIVRWKNDKTQQLFDDDESISKGIKALFSLFINSYTLNTQVKQIIFPREKINIVSQYIDTYGKCRKLFILYKNVTFTIFTDPLPPFKIKENNDSSIMKISKKEAIEFTVENDLDILYQNNGKQLNEICCRNGNVSIYIPIKDAEFIEGVSKNKSNIIKSDNYSEMVKYNNDKKLARYIVEYTFWLFSKYVNQLEVTKISDKVLNKFYTERIVIDSERNYGDIDKYFTMDCSFIKNNRLCVQSEEMAKRLLYTLKLFSIRNLTGLLSYKDKETIQNYFLDITDFNEYSHQIILYGEDSVEKWIRDHRQIYLLYDSIVIRSSIPYFFKNDLIGENIYLAQNTNSIEKAVELGNNWLENDYNSILYVDPVNKDNLSLRKFTICKYINNSKIERINTGSSDDVIILGYKIQNSSFYTILMKL